MDQLSLTAPASSQTPSANHHHPPASDNNNNEMISYSIRSEADAEALFDAYQMRGNYHNDHPSVSARTMNDALDGGTEYLLVDGDLIEVPATAPSEEQEIIEDQLRRERRRRQCQPSSHGVGGNNNRMRRGVRKISKFFKRVRRTTSRESADNSNHSTYHNNNNNIHNNNNNISEPPAVETAAAPSPKRKEKKKNKARLSWRRNEPNLSELAEELEENEGPNFSSVMTGLESPVRSSSLMASNSRSQDRFGQDEDGLGHDPLSPPVSSSSPLRETSEASRPGHRRMGSGRTVHADYVGTADQMGALDYGIVSADVAAVAFIDDSSDMTYWKKDDGSIAIPPSALPIDADFKVDKSDGPDVETMLMRAAQETTNDLDSSDLPPPPSSGGKSTSSLGTPLSQARRNPCTAAKVYNDMLKVVMVAAPGVDKSRIGRWIRNSHKRPRARATLGVDVHSWTPLEESDSNIKFMIWDVQGATGAPEDCANFGAHPGTQSLFFSGQSLYVLVTDLAFNNRKTFPSAHYDHCEYDDVDEGDDDDEEEEDDFAREQATRRADRALRADLDHRVLSWVDTIARRGPNSAIFPVALVPPGMAAQEVKRRCEMLQNALLEHSERFEGPKILSGADSLLCVDTETGEGMDRLQETILAIASDASKSVFDHVGSPVPQGTVQVLEVVRRFKEDHKLILLDHLLAALGDSMKLEEVLEALQFLSNVGEILYFGTADDEVLSRYIILSRKWLVSALSCILRNDLKRELAETRRFMNMQCIYSHQKFTEHEVIRTLVSGTLSSCPLLSNEDAKMLWQSMSFMREAADHYSQLSESSTSTPTMFYFLERLLVHAGIFLPLSSEQVFFVPSLLAQADPREVWTYKSSESWMTTLCHSWLFRDGVPSNLMEELTVKVLGDLHAFCKKFQVARGKPPTRSQTVPIRDSSVSDFVHQHENEALGRVKIHQIVCWNSSLLVKIGTVFADPESGELRESFVEIFVAIVDQSDNHCVASDAMRANMQRVVVSGKGQVGHHGKKIWRGGYEVILQSVRESLSIFSNVDSQVICPECLARSSPRSASTWSWDSVYALAQSGSSVVRCMRGHRLDSNLICGTRGERKQAPVIEEAAHRVSKPVSEILPSVVVVGLWDARTNEIRNVGSGFVVDKKLGLVVTAGHILFNMEGGAGFGCPYFGLPDAKAVIGVIPEGGGHTAVWRYFGDIVMDDVHNVDACVVRIKTRMEQDVDGQGGGCEDQPERVLTLDTIPDEKLRALKMTSRFELEESIRVLGYNQGGEGVYEKGKHVNRSADFAKGYICRTFRAPIPDDSSSDDSGSHMSFSPREEIVIMCPTISGHSGGPCVNDEGRVVGILSRADPVDRQRCYLVPASELKTLVVKAKKHCTRPTPIIAHLPMT